MHIRVCTHQLQPGKSNNSIDVFFYSIFFLIYFNEKKKEVIKIQKEVEDLTKRKNLCEESIHFAHLKIKQLDAMIEAAEKQFNYKKDQFNDQTKRFQTLLENKTKEIETINSKLGVLENKIEELFICPYCSKEYKTQKGFENHISKCQEEQDKVKRLEAEKAKLEKEIAKAKAEEEEITESEGD